MNGRLGIRILKYAKIFAKNISLEKAFEIKPQDSKYKIYIREHVFM